MALAMGVAAGAKLGWGHRGDLAAPAVAISCARCRSNLMGTKFTVFDNGANPDRANADWSNVRQELSAVVYVRSPWDLLGRRQGGP